ncbi:M56 family metallopeptidase [Seonamhaeicola aphaedonensis]|uniref:Beta-lactamase regulating signal transducer with metallopeptidase domain n=1 Tax=Seonamhaeicola aphaedonensis TaxID=1461338 RepID=A0A3D9HD19_9FLAO|nr:M56 family metallopeptidase [Seonamhaeicola aphaedonensis]RED47382.1 beta-lactamase regulating signal transducer with metallopeptidase domain [Seonamhaeicola aphaedonensis]
MEYLLKASAIIAIFYACYKSFLQRDTFFQSNRGFLIIGLSSAFLVPLIIIPVYIEHTPVLLDNFVFDTSIPVTQQIVEESINLIDIITYLYFAGIAFFLGRFLFQLSSLIVLLLKYKRTREEEFILVKTNSTTTPFSFFKWIVYNPELFTQTELHQILIHEKVHVRQYHSIDILLSQLASIVLWFNPFIWLYSKDLKQNLEFIADNEAQKKVDCKKSYQNILLKTCMPTHQLALTNNFYNSLIKKRIVMLHKSKSKSINLLKYLFIFPALSWFLMSFNTKEVFVSKDENILFKENKQELTNNTIEIKIHKDLSKKALKEIESILIMDGIIFTYTSLERNDKNEITYIKTKFEVQNGGHCTFNAINNNGPIQPFYFYKTKEKFGVRAHSRENQESNKFVIYNNFSDYQLENFKNKLSLKGFKFNLKEISRDDGNFITSIYFTVTKNGIEDSYRMISPHPLKTILIQYNKEKNHFNINTADFVEYLKTIENEANLIKIFINPRTTLESLTEQQKLLKEKYDIDFTFKIFESERSESNLMTFSIGKGKNSRKITTSSNNTQVIIYDPKTNAAASYSLDENSTPKYGRIYHLYDSGAYSYIVNKDISDSGLNRWVKEMQEKGITVKFEDVERNEKGEITKIKITIENKINKVSETWETGGQPIPQISVGNDNSGQVFARTSNLLYQKKASKD